MSRRVAPSRVAELQRLYLQRQGASAQEIRRYQPILTAQIGAESNFTQGIGSPAGAQDIAQFMPGTAPGYGVRLGDNRIKDDIRGQVRYMLPLLRKYGVEDALRGYNAGIGAIDRSRGFSETNNYVRKVRGSAGEYRGLGGGRGGGGGPAQQMLQALSGPSAGSSLPGGGGSTLALLEALQGGQRASGPPSGGLAAPAHSAGPVMPQGLQAAVSGGGPAARPDTAALMAAVRTMGEGMPGVPGGVLPGGGGQPQAGQPAGGGGGRLGRVTVASGADRAGVATNRQVIRFVRRIAGIAGRPLTIGTGTNHSQMTVNGNVSQHWTGDAADIPATGKTLIRLGQAALIAAGMSRRKARQQTGGLFNVGGRQIIFNTQQGGDHTDHLHVGL